MPSARLIPPFTATVSSVLDGDTITLQPPHHFHAIRIAHIDAPEDGQPWAAKATEALRSLILGQEVKIRPLKHDCYSRLIAEVQSPSGTPVHLLMLGWGLAWHDAKHSRDQDAAFFQALARVHRIGLWSDPHPEPPWEFRRRTHLRHRPRDHHTISKNGPIVPPK
jgi:endonuclease YncB( thermonuclease family)